MPKISDYIKLQPKQQECYQYIGRGYIVFFGGSRGGGKSHLALASGVLSALRFPGMTVGIFRKHFNELVENFIDRLKTLYPPDVFGYTYKEQKKIAYFNNGSKIVFRSAEREVDVDKILGLEYQFIIVDEGNQFQERSIKRMVGSLRNPNIPNWRPTMLVTGNPGGVSDVFFKTHFVNPDYKYWEPAELKVKDKYIFIPATVYDNKILVENDPGYIENLESLPDHLRDAWLHGSWDVFEGRFFSEWNDDVHVIDPFDIPPEWKRICGIDVGFSDRHPSVCVWIAQDPNTEDLYVYREYVANQVIEEFALMVSAYSEQEAIDAYYIDTSAFVSNKLKYDDESAARIFLTTAGIVVFPAIKDRLNGWRIFKSWLHWTEKYHPKLRFFRNCEKCSLYLPQLLYAKSDGMSEDCNTDMRDDEADAVRYALASDFGFPGTLKERAEIVIEDKVDKYKKDFFAASPEEGIPLSETYSIKYNNFLIDDPSDGRSVF